MRFAPQNINGKIAFKARIGEKWFIINDKGEKVKIINDKGEKVDGEFDEVGNPQNINGKIAFAAKKVVFKIEDDKITEEKKWFIVNNEGEKVGGKFDWVGDPQNINGKMVFAALQGEEWFIINEDGKEILSADDIYAIDPGTQFNLPLSHYFSADDYVIDLETKRVIYKKNNKYISRRLNL